MIDAPRLVEELAPLKKAKPAGHLLSFKTRPLKIEFTDRHIVFASPAGVSLYKRS